MNIEKAGKQYYKPTSTFTSKTLINKMTVEKQRENKIQCIKIL